MKEWGQYAGDVVRWLGEVWRYRWYWGKRASKEQDVECVAGSEGAKEVCVGLGLDDLGGIGAAKVGVWETVGGGAPVGVALGDPVCVQGARSDTLRCLSYPSDHGHLVSRLDLD